MSNLMLKDLDLFEEIFGPRPPRRKIYDRLMATDIKKDKDGNYQVMMNLPGIKKGDVDVTYQDELLSVSVNSSVKENDEYIIQERTFSGKRSFNVPELDINTLKARMEDGVLYLNFSLKKEELPETHKVTIE